MKEPYVTDYYGCNTFDDSVLRARLSRSAYEAMDRVIRGQDHMTIELANQVAAAMREWAIELGATHYTHWFQPMTGATAEKHDALISPSENGGVMIDFDGKALIRGETDASSFPSGGLRETFEARGYTTWDCTSPPFVRKTDAGASTLCIPTAFCSFTGEALDEKTPLLRSMEALSRQAVRVLHDIGYSDVQKVTPTVGAEQEYFMIDKAIYRKRKDLIYTGRTLFGAPPAKGQELEDQYYATMSERVASFMVELNRELWEMGVPAKTQHNEAAPAQYELAPVFTSANIATDHNQIIMETLKRVADRHEFACLLHEKPFAFLTGSGKHDNWSIITDTGKNLLKPGKNPEDLLIFQTFFVAVMAAVDRYAPALRMCCASFSNEARLGGHEAPPNIISMFVGQKLADMLDQLANGCDVSIGSKEEMTIGVNSLPMLLRDDSDRNRTSPFAFTANKFEFRMVGSSQSLGMPNTVMNSIVADVLQEIADAMEKSEDKQAALQKMLCKLIVNHRKILFNGNNYSQEWIDEAARRKLPRFESTVDAIQIWNDIELREMFKRQAVFSDIEMHARCEIALKSYSAHASLEAITMIKMSKQTILPACVRYSTALAQAVQAVEQAGVDASTHKELLRACCERIRDFSLQIQKLEKALEESKACEENAADRAKLFETLVNPQAKVVRACADELEKIVDKQFWPLPSYGEMLFCAM